MKIPKRKKLLLGTRNDNLFNLFSCGELQCVSLERTLGENGIKIVICLMQKSK